MFLKLECINCFHLPIKTCLKDPGPSQSTRKMTTKGNAGGCGFHGEPRAFPWLPVYEPGCVLRQRLRPFREAGQMVHLILTVWWDRPMLSRGLGAPQERWDPDGLPCISEQVQPQASRMAMRSSWLILLGKSGDKQESLCFTNRRGTDFGTIKS